VAAHQAQWLQATQRFSLELLCCLHVELLAVGRPRFSEVEVKVQEATAVLEVLLH